MKKIIIIAVIAIAVVGLVAFGVTQSQRNAISVQTGPVVKEDLSTVVSASGEIKPKTYVNVGANAMGKITHLYVKEGDHVKKGQILAQLENVQAGADVAAQRAMVNANQTDAAAAVANTATNVADYNRAQAAAASAKLDYDRAVGLYKDQLIAKQDFDTKKAAWEVADAQVVQAKARIAQSKAQEESAIGHVNSARATLTHATDVLDKTIYAAPYDGVITNLPVREGETVVMGIQNAPGSTLMTLADLSVITAEVMVDETDIVNVKLNQPADVTVDAIPGKVFKGHVTEIGDNAVIRSTGVATTQTTGGSQEAKDFKVVVTLDNPSDNLRPGLSTTAKITTAAKSGVLAIPIQALTIRTQKDLETKPATSGSAQAAAPPAAGAKKDEEIQGVFVINKSGGSTKVKFVPVKTGITGATDIEVTNGLAKDDQIVTGSYKVLRTLKNNATVKIDNSVEKKDDSNS